MPINAYIVYMKVEKEEIKSLRCKCCNAELFHDHDDEFYFSNDLCLECSGAVEDQIYDID